jgi:phage-related protein
VSQEVADLYIRLRSNALELLPMFDRAGSSGERMGSKIRKSADDIDRDHRKIAMSARQMEDAIRRSVEGIIKDHDQAIRSTGQVSQSVEDMRLKNATAYEKLAQQHMTVVAKMDDANRKAVASTEKMAGEIDAAAKRSLVTTQGKIDALGDAALAIGVVSAATAAVSVKMAGDFELGTTRLVTSAGEARANLDSVRSGLLLMAGQIGYSTNELIDALIRVNSAGYHGADGLKVLKAAAQGAKAENADLVTVADAVTSVLADYRHMGYSAADVTTKLVVATSQGKTTMQELAGSLSAVLPIASSSKIAFEDIIGAQASMTVHGMSARQSAQNLADAIRHMVAPTQVQAKELGQLGLSAQDLAGMLEKKGLTGTLNFLSETILSKMGPSGKVMLDAFNQSKDAARAATDMIKAMPPAVAELAQKYREGAISLGDYKAAMKALPSDQANLAKQFMSLQDRAAGFSDLLKQGQPAAQSYQDALRRVMGDATGLNVALMLTGHNTAYTTEAVKNITAATADAAGNVKGWGDIQETFNQSVSEARYGIEALATKIGMHLLPYFGQMADRISRATSWLLQHEGATKMLAAIIGGGLVVALVLATAWAWNFAAALWATGIPEIILAIVAIGVAIYGVIEYFDLFERAIKPFAAWMYTNVIQPVQRAFSALWEQAIKPILRDVGSFADELWADLRPALSALKTELGGAFAVAKEELRKHLPEIKAWVRGLRDDIREFLAKVRAWWNEYGPPIKAWGREIFQFLREYGPPAIRIMIDSLSRFFGMFGAGLRFLVGVVRTVIMTIVGILQGLRLTLGGVIDFVRGVFTGDWDMAWQGVQQIFRGTFKIIESLAGLGMGLVKEIILAQIRLAAAALGIDLDAVKETFRAKFAEAAGIVARAWDSITGFFASGGDRLRFLWAWAWEMLRAAAIEGAARLIAFVMNIPSLVAAVFAGAGSWLWSAGWRILSGLLDGLRAKWAEVQALIRSMGPWIAANKGPAAYDATLLTPAGGLIMGGLLAGLESGATKVKRFIRAFTGDLAATQADVTGTLSMSGEFTGARAVSAGRVATGVRGGSGGSTTVVNLKVDVHGAVLAEHDLHKEIQKVVVRHVGRNSGPGFNPAFS